ncbi:type VII secretion-associated serine protease mycosin [Spinactinospora alkalitolerans]|uniref:Type VII secretion-associated serine protease mycosin n=1 Tax=Spinactinospora alkalitolerans TaxID=687207 RepID=A0A852TMI6_9ACTN|nr:S8 family serine peptidase [Spinactinospora alkalitolerans]NYE45159.1 type VII secretion-associated serine protease mycosin [Spinactinospora alkalitolerans]
MRTKRTGTFVALGTCAAIIGGQLTAAAPAAADTEAGNLRYDQWGLEAVEAAEAWEESRGSGVTVALLDTGVDDTHPDLADTVTLGPDYTGQDLEPGDEHYGEHGTMMAGIIAANGHGKEHSGGVMGVAPEAGILSIRVALEEDDPGRDDPEARAARSEALAKGVRHAVDQGAQVISMSIGDASGDYEGSEAEQEAIDYAERSGVVVIASGGNGGAAGEPAYPAAYDGVLAVGSVDADLRVSEFSSLQDHIALTAPGEEIATTGPGGRYLNATGTSAAAAFVTGVAALIRSAHPQLRPDQVVEALLAGAQPPAGAQTGGGYGAGVISAPEALAAAGRTAEDVPPFNPELAQNGDDGLPVPAWTLWAGAAALVLVLGAVGIVLLRRSMVNPYGLPEREEDRGPAAPRRGRRRARGGGRRRLGGRRRR